MRDGDTYYKVHSSFEYYPGLSKGKIEISMFYVPARTYTVEIYNVGYHVNDAYTEYVDMGKPKQLNTQQVDELKKHNNGVPIAIEAIELKTNEVFSKELYISENDVYMLNLIKR